MSQVNWIFHDATGRLSHVTHNYHMWKLLHQDCVGLVWSNVTDGSLRIKQPRQQLSSDFDYNFAEIWSVLRSNSSPKYQPEELRQSCSDRNLSCEINKVGRECWVHVALAARGKMLIEEIDLRAFKSCYFCQSTYNI